MPDEPKSRPKSRRPGQFTGRDDPRNGPGKGPKKGAPNAGRRPDEVRALSRAGYMAAVPKLAQIAQGEHVKGTLTLADGTTRDIDIRPDASAMARAADILGKYGLPTQLEVAGDPHAPLIVQFRNELPTGS